MPDFVWLGLDGQGQRQTGHARADSMMALVTQLRARQITLISAQPARADGLPPSTVPAAPTGLRRNWRADRVERADVLLLTSELAIMLRAGLPLDTALRLLGEMLPKPSSRALVGELLDAVKNGQAFSRALSAYPAQFNDFYQNMVRAGEASGQLSGALESLVEHLERLRALRDSVVSASLYPAILAVVALASLLAVLGLVVPQFKGVFGELGDALPLPTQAVLWLSNGLVDRWMVWLLVAVVSLWLAGRWLRSPAGRQWRDRLVLRLPMAGPIMRKYQLTLFSRSLGTLLGNGVPLLTSLQIATDTVSNRVLAQPLREVPPQVKAGGRLADALARSAIFDPLACNLIRVGEETGRLGSMALEVAQVYNREVENGIKRGLTVLEPLLILVLGGLIAGIIVSILLGILAVNNLAL